MASQNPQSNVVTGAKPFVIPLDRFASPAEVLAHIQAGHEILGHPELSKASFPGATPEPDSAAKNLPSLSRAATELAQQLRRIGLAVHGFESPRMFPDDRFADNTNLIFDGYELLQPKTVALPTRQHLLLHAFQNEASSKVREFLLRTPEAYMRLLYSHLGVNSIPKLEHAVATMNTLEQERHGCNQNATEFLAETPAVLLEMLLINARAATVDEFCKHARAQWFIELREFFRSDSRTKYENIAAINDLGRFASEHEFLRTFRNRVFVENLTHGDIGALSEIIRCCENDPQELRRKVIEIATSFDLSSLASEFHDIATSLGGRRIPKEYGEFILDILKQGEYLQQNVYAVRELERAKVINSAADVSKLRELQKRFNGFITPALGRRYLEAESPDAQEMLFARYAELHRLVLSSERISEQDPDLLAEVILQAYRPAGYSVATIANQIRQGTVCDNTDHLANVKFDPNGYEMHVSLSKRSMESNFDHAGLAKIDSGLTQIVPPSVLAEAISSALNNGPERDAARRTLLLCSLLATNDARVTGYVQEQLLSGGTASYTGPRLSQLAQMLQVIPAEDIFTNALQTVLKSDLAAEQAMLAATEKALWFERKGKATREERACKNKVDQILKELTSPENDVTELLKSSELAFLGEPIRAELLGLRGKRLEENLYTLKCERFLGCGASEVGQRGVNLYLSAARTAAHTDSLFIRHELEKITAVKSEEKATLRAVISKNSGSFYAKAGVAICTSGNTEMWNEKRHLHLNIVQGEQIIGNIMLYLEEKAPLNEYLIARGFNPRDDALWNFDHRSLAEEITRVLAHIAKENKRIGVFITEQTPWHELGNRDVFAQQILEIANRTMVRVSREAPDQRTVITDANFSVTEEKEYGHKSQKLLLLTLAAAA